MLIPENKKKQIIEIVRSGGVGIIPTDTIYGIVANAFSKSAVKKIYKLRKRNPKKPMIILICSLSDLKKFDIQPTLAMKKHIEKLWPGKVSIIFPCASKKFSYLHRGTKALALRLPAQKWLQNLLKKMGPLVAPSANIEGMPPARTISKAQSYFGNRVDFYLDGGRVSSKPSTLMKIQSNGIIDVVRA